MPQIGDTLTLQNLNFVFRVVRPSETFLGRITGTLCVNHSFVMKDDHLHPVYVLDPRTKPLGTEYLVPVLPGGYRIQPSASGS